MEPEKIVTGNDVLEALTALYRDTHTDYQQSAETAKRMYHEGDKPGYKKLNRRAQKIEQRMEGIVQSAEALGYGWDEFMAAVNADRMGTETEGD